MSRHQALTRRAMRCLCAAAVLAVGCAGVSAPLASADADPASDILLGSPVFYPYQPAVSQSLQHELEGALGKLKAKGVDLKVAIIESAPDLGAVANLFGKPQLYASFLDQEISFGRPQPLLVVMPDGFGVSHAAPPGALAGAKIDSTHQSDGLARSALTAVLAIARALGKPVSGGGTPPASGGSGTSPLITFGAPVIVVVLAVAGVVLVRRRVGPTGGRTPGRRR